MRELVRDPAGAGARGKFARRHLLRMEAAFPQQRPGYDDDLMLRQRRICDRVRTRYVVDETITRRHFDATAVLLEIGSSKRLEQDLDVGMFGRSNPPVSVTNPVLTDLDLAELQAGDSRVVDPPFQR